MKYFLATALLLLVFFLAASAAQNPLCAICQPFVTIPKNWAGAQTMLKMGCNKLGEAQNACNGLVDAADLTSSYPNMYPHLVTLKEIGCKKYCA